MESVFWDANRFYWLIFFGSDEVISIMEQYFAEIAENHYRDDLKLFQAHWNKSIDVGVDYIENIISFSVQYFANNQYVNIHSKLTSVFSRKI